MRVIAGKARRLPLKTVKGMNTRPTTDRIKETLFNMINNKLPNANFLDLYSGSGAIGIEALSRGAKYAVCTDLDANSVKIIKKNADELQFDNIEILNQDAMGFIKNSNSCFSVIFLDPPYNKGFIKPIIEAIIENGLLETDGIIVLESDNSDEHSEISGLDIIKQKRYGRTYVTVYQRR